MLFKCLPPGAVIPGRFPGPAHSRGKWFTVDIHCHVLTPKAAEMVAGNADATRHPREVYANERTREVNRQQAERISRAAEADRIRAEHSAIAAVESERRRIARETHDIVGHALNVILLQAGAARIGQGACPDCRTRPSRSAASTATRRGQPDRARRSR